MSWIEPFSLLYLSTNIRNFKRSRPEADFTAINFEGHTYAGHMGFFNAFNVAYGNKPGDAIGSDRYLPITTVSIEALTNDAREDCRYIGDLIEARAEKLAQLLCREERSSLVDTLAYAFREIMRNAVEHSESKEFEYCGQSWTSQNKVEVSVLDCGIGVRKSLSRNPRVKIRSDDHALRLALLPGISGKVTKSKQIGDYDHWENSGYGLYMTSRLCAIGGNFFTRGKRFQEPLIL